MFGGSLFSTTTFSVITSKPKTLFLHSSTKPSYFLSLSSKSKTFHHQSSPTTKMSSSSSSISPIKTPTIEHVVLFNVKEDTDQSKINSMINGLNSLISLDQLLHLTAGPIFRNLSSSSSFKFTHLLHTRYKSKEDLNAYTVHPDHKSVVKESILPIINDIMAVDWVSDLDDPFIIKSGSALRLKFLKLKENLGENEKSKILDLIGGVKDRVDSIKQLSFGENFSPARSKGFSIASIAVVPGLEDLDGLGSNKEEVKEQTVDVNDSIEDMIDLDYVVPGSSQSVSNL